MGVLRTKSIEQSIRDTEESEHKLRKDLSAWDLTVFGIGVIIGTGIFVLTGIAAATKAGPAVSLSFVLAGVACALAALCYAEFASTVPVAGSAYTFSYASLGELIAWIIGWDLVLEFALGAAAVAVGWASTSRRCSPSPSRSPARAGQPGRRGDRAVLTAVSIIGVKLSSRFNAVMVAIKLAVVALFIGAGAVKISTANWSPFIPPPAEAPKAANAVEAGRPDRGPVRARAAGLRLARHRLQGGDRVLRLHRLRRGRHHRRGDPQPPARHAHRHPRVAGHLHRALRGRVAGADRDRQVPS